jgi:HSP20 family protein
MRFPHDPVMRMLLHNFMNQEQETERKCRWMPATNITENDQAYLVEMAVPGFSKEDFKISMEKDILTVVSERNKDKKAEEKNEQAYCRHEFGKGDFNRSFHVPEQVDADSIKAEYVNGILSITLPKKEVVKVSKEIQVV